MYNIDNLLNILKYVTPVAIVLGSCLLGYFFEKRLLQWLNKVAKTTAWEGDDLLIDSLKYVTTIWFIIGGISLAITTIPLELKLFVFVQKGLLAAFLASVTLVISRISVKLIRLFNSKNDSSPVLTSLFETLTKVFIFTVGTLIILQSIGVAITPLLTAFGVGGVSIGLALQGTLSNFMSGINIITSKKIRPGDYIKLKTGEEGYVMDVELKYTVIKDLTDNIMVIPNASLLASSFVNYGLPDKQMLIAVKVRISYDSDLQQVETVTLEVAKQVMQEVEGGIPEYIPFMRYTKFDYFSINFTVYLSIREYYDQLIIQHEFIKRLHNRYKEEGIKIPTLSNINNLR